MHHRAVRTEHTRRKSGSQNFGSPATPPAADSRVPVTAGGHRAVFKRSRSEHTRRQHGPQSFRMLSRGHGRAAEQLGTGGGGQAAAERSLRPWPPRPAPGDAGHPARRLRFIRRRRGERGTGRRHHHRAQYLAGAAVRPYLGPANPILLFTGDDGNPGNPEVAAAIGYSGPAVCERLDSPPGPSGTVTTDGGVEFDYYYDPTGQNIYFSW